MKRAIFLTLIAAMFIGAGWPKRQGNFSQSTTLIADFETIGAPALSASGEARFYFDGTNLQLSENGGAFAAVLSGTASIYPQSGLTVGDMVYADGAASIAQLAAVASGQVLTSAGAGVAPAWSGSPTLSGDLAVDGGDVNLGAAGTQGTIDFLATDDQALITVAALGGGTTEGYSVQMTDDYLTSENIWQVGDSGNAQLARITGIGALFLANSAVAASVYDTNNNVLIGGAGVEIASDEVLEWSNATSVWSGAPDLAISRTGVSTMQIDDAAAGAATVNVIGAITATTDITSSDTGDLGWSVQTGVNTACTTTCTSAAVFGVDSGGTGLIVGPADATAEECVCAGAS